MHLAQCVTVAERGGSRAENNEENNETDAVSASPFLPAAGPARPTDWLRRPPSALGGNGLSRRSLGDNEITDSYHVT